MSTFGVTMTFRVQDAPTMADAIDAIERRARLDYLTPATDPLSVVLVEIKAQEKTKPEPGAPLTTTFEVMATFETIADSKSQAVRGIEGRCREKDRVALLYAAVQEIKR